MINIRVGEPLPEHEQMSKFAFELGTTPAVLDAQRLSVEFRCKFAKLEGVDYAVEAKSIQTSIQTLLKISKGLNYIAKLILEELDLTASVSQVGEDSYLVLQLVVLDPSHSQNLNNIVEKLKSREHPETIEVDIQSNTVGTNKADQAGTAGLYTLIKTELYQGTRESLKQVVEAASDTQVADSFIKPLLYILSLRKLTLEVDLATELWELLPEGCPAILRKGLPKLEGNTKFPLTTSMKKIATTFRDKLVGDWALTAQVGSLTLNLSLRYRNIFDNFLSSFVDL